MVSVKEVDSRLNRKLQLFIEKQIALGKLSRDPANVTEIIVPEYGIHHTKAHKNISEFWVRQIELPPFFPKMNILNCQANLSKEYILEVQNYLAQVTQSLQHLISFRFNVFWSQVLYDPTVCEFLESFLLYSSRSYELHIDPHFVSKLNIPEEILSLYFKLYEYVLLVYYRLSLIKESDSEFLSITFYENLIKERSIINFPKLCDIANIYLPSNRGIVSTIIQNFQSSLPNLFILDNIIKEFFISQLKESLNSFIGIELKSIPFESIITSPEINNKLWMTEATKQFIDIIDLVMTLLCMTQLFPTKYLMFIWDIPNDTPNKHNFDDSSDNGLIKIIKRIYYNLVKSFWLNLVNHPETDKVLVLAVLRLRAAITRCIYFYLCLRYLRLHINQNIFSKLSKDQVIELNRSKFIYFYNWMTSFLDEFVLLEEDANIIPLKEDLRRSKFEELFEQWTMKDGVDFDKIEALKDLLIINETNYSDTEKSESTQSIITKQEHNDIRTLSDILSGHSEGFLLLSLRFYGGNVEETLNNLIEDNLPDALKSLNKSISLKEALKLDQNESGINNVNETKIVLAGAGTAPISPNEATGDRISLQPPTSKKSFYNKFSSNSDLPNLTEEEKEKVLNIYNNQIKLIYDDEFDDSLQYPNHFQSSPAYRESDKEDADSDEAGDEEIKAIGEKTNKTNSMPKLYSKAKASNIKGQVRDSSQNRMANHNMKDRRRSKMSRGMI